MAYGVSSTTVLLAAGVAPALASAAVHIAEIGTTAVSGISHSSFGNVDWSKIVWLAVPGGIGALVGRWCWSGRPRWRRRRVYVEPAVAIFLFFLGIYVLSRFAFRRTERPVEVRPVAAGVPEPARVCGRVPRRLGRRRLGARCYPDAALFRADGAAQDRRHRRHQRVRDRRLVRASGFLIGLSLAELPWTIIGALFLGGLIAAPIAAYIVSAPADPHHRHRRRRVYPRRQREHVLRGHRAPVQPITVAFIAIIAVWIAALVFAIAARRREQAVGAGRTGCLSPATLRMTNGRGWTRSGPAAFCCANAVRE